MLLAAWSLRRLRGPDGAGRVLAMALAFSTVATIAHAYKQPRFFFMTAALMWIVGSREAIELAKWASSRAGEFAQRRIAAATAGAALVAATLVAVNVDRLHEGHRRHTVHVATAELLNVITEQAEAIESSILLGTWNHLSPWLVEWSCLQRGPSMETTQVPRSPTSRRSRKDVVGWLLASQPDLVMVVSTAPGSLPRAGFAKETGWLDSARKRLVRDPRFLLVSRKDFAATGYRLECFEPGRTDREPVPR
jgi:hypothetical protein